MVLKGKAQERLKTALRFFFIPGTKSKVGMLVRADFFRALSWGRMTLRHVPALPPKGKALRCVARGLNFFSICGSIIQKTDGDLHNCKSFLR